MHSPSTGGADPRGLLRIAIPSDVVLAVQVHFRPERARDPEELERFVLEWIRRHARDPLRGAVREHLAANPWKISIVDVREAPRPLPCHVAALAPEGRLCMRESLQCIQVGTKDALRRPRPGLWAVFAAGRALAEALDGVIFDLLNLGLTYRPARRLLPPDGLIHVADHILVLQSVNERGLGWTTTTGMPKFGLPNLQIEETPVHLARPLAAILRVVAQKLAGRVLERAGTEPAPRAGMLLDRTLTLHPADVARAAGGGASSFRSARDATVGLAYAPARPHREPFITVLPPEGFRGGSGVWAHDLVETLTGRSARDRMVNLCAECAGHGPIQQAHRRAVKELPDVKRRFREGLGPGRVLLVKAPFPFGEGGIEYMWVGVTTWRGIRIQGLLTNEPAYRTDLRAGDPIELDEMEVYDWMIQASDGSRRGGYTDRALRGEDDGGE
ncbi:MAG: DUF2314 domain-containing protein [Planctomycetes bacterium]|nr:DUF2314 domain-containing protein [Planctomycetota bacterium]